MLSLDNLRGCDIAALTDVNRQPADGAPSRNGRFLSPSQ
jgi:hypothetical protein